MNTENNKIIAEFMGVEQLITENKFLSMELLEEDNPTIIENLKYHSDWNWLMEVVHKCLEICHEEMFNEWENSFADKFLACDIEVLYKESLEFIKWYNLNK